MNKRIEEFAEQSSLIKRNGAGELIVWSCYHPDLEKFAEMIIQECCNTILEFDYDYCTSPNKAMVDAAEDIKQHFGVK